MYAHKHTEKAQGQNICFVFLSSMKIYENRAEDSADFNEAVMRATQPRLCIFLLCPQ